jgi:chorismate synthase
VDSVTCGAPFAAIIRNTNTRSSDYREIRDIPRPGHADYTANVKYGGWQDVAGGGHFSARLTAPMCIAGGICLQILHRRGVSIGAHILSVGGAFDDSFDPVNVNEDDFALVHGRDFPVLNADAGLAMQEKIMQAKSAGDSVGGILECAAVGMPAGYGAPIFDGIENRISQAVFGIPAVKGIEFGAGFGVSTMLGSENNDSFYIDGGIVKTRTNNHGGILGGITSSMPIIFRAAFKPTPSIAMEQDSVSLSNGTNARLSVKGRHDPCVAVRAVACVEAAAAIALCDTLFD